MDIYASHNPPPGFSLFCTQTSTHQTSGSPSPLACDGAAPLLVFLYIASFSSLFYTSDFCLCSSAVISKMPRQASGFGMTFVLFHAVVPGSRLPYNPLFH